MIDLHTHTRHSDGADSVEEILKKANEKGLEILSITDHDNVGAYFGLEEKPSLRKLYNGKIIPGVELKTCYDGISIEILGYGIDYKKIKIHKVNQEIILEHLKKVGKSLNLKLNEKELLVDENDTVKRFAGFAFATEILKYEENKEIINKIGPFEKEHFFRVHQSNKNSPFYFDETNILLDINETISRIHEAGGLAFLAHGYIYPFENKDVTLEEILATTDIDGMECIHSQFTEEEIKKAFELCKKYNKYSSGGTDYHAENKPNIELGTGKNGNVKVEKYMIENWIDKINFI